MARLAWSTTGSRVFETGLDRGVLYPRGYTAKDTSSKTAISTGSITFSSFTAPMAQAFPISARIKVTNATGLVFMVGYVTASSKTSVTISVTGSQGVGTFASWTLVSEGLAVAWNGLTSVEEGGGEAAVTSYMDGRPFLSMTRPKEYQAKLNAYTFPDEFSAIMGVQEAADGMYLDSQQQDAFNLCYRTRIGNDVDGLDYGYKIHLVYNATAVPSSVSYASLSDQASPSDFSWDIRAIPMVIDGYNPTAHIVIDTRHLQASKLTTLEDMLYGTSTQSGYLPDPQQLYDLLSYGDVITVTDNGDGTWTVEGSYKNVYLTGASTFEITNINSTDTGGGTYTISSTP